MRQASAGAALALLLHAALGLSAAAEETLPRPEPKFQGRIGRNAKESTPEFPKDIQAPPGAPNVLLIMTDDVGFGAKHLRRTGAHAHLGPARPQRPPLQSVSPCAMCSPTRAAR